MKQLDVYFDQIDFIKPEYFAWLKKQANVNNIDVGLVPNTVRSLQNSKTLWKKLIHLVDLGVKNV